MPKSFFLLFCFVIHATKAIFNKKHVPKNDLWMSISLFTYSWKYNYQTISQFLYLYLKKKQYVCMPEATRLTFKLSTLLYVAFFSKATSKIPTSYWTISSFIRMTIQLMAATIQWSVLLFKYPRWALKYPLM